MSRVEGFSAMVVAYSFAILMSHIVTVQVVIPKKVAIWFLKILHIAILNGFNFIIIATNNFQSH